MRVHIIPVSCILFSAILAGGWRSSPADELLGRLHGGTRDERIQALVAISRVQKPEPALLDALVDFISTPGNDVRDATAYAIAHVAIALGCDSVALDECSTLTSRYNAVPKARHKVMPSYPDGAKRAGRQGVVMMQFLVAEDGTVQDVRVLAGPNFFRKLAVETLRSWTYEPARAGGRAVPFLMVFTMSWKLS